MVENRTLLTYSTSIWRPRVHPIWMSPRSLTSEN